MRKLSLLLAFCLVLTTATAQDYDIYLFLGQSNCAGRGYMLPNDTTGTLDGVWLLNAQGLPEPAKAPLNRYSNIRKGIEWQMIGPAYQFCQEVHRSNGRPILLIQNARGGSALQSWQPGGDGQVSYLDSALVRILPALQYGKVKAILWHQGETDIEKHTAGELYLQRFQAMISTLRSQLPNGNDIPVIVGEVGQWAWAPSDSIQAFNHGTLDQLTRLVPNCHKVSSDGLERRMPDNPGDPHFSRAAQIELGHRYAQAYLATSPTLPPLMAGINAPVGESFGIHPGRVAWVHCPGVADWDGETGLWVEDRWNDQDKADRMVQQVVMTITGQKEARKAWSALFQDFNSRHDKGRQGYRPGQKIAIKLNINNALTHHDTIELNSSPFVTLALLKTLIRDGGVREEDVTVCEPSRAIPDSIYNKCHRAFPGVHFVDNIGGDGREKCEYYYDQIHYSVDNGKMARGIAKCVKEADYLINSALLKTHVGPGVTLCAKNWYGATDIYLNWRRNAHDHINQDKKHRTPQYKTFVDWMGHRDMGQKCLLFLIDGTYASRDVNGAPKPKWQKAPFNGGWCCSLIGSQDGVACDAVGMDLIISEWPDYPSLNYCDEYLNEAALLPHPLSGATYDPEGDGVPLDKPLGLFEHCDSHRHYTKLDLQYVEMK